MVLDLIPEIRHTANMMSSVKEKTTKYKAWFKIVNESKWCTAAKEWDTKEEATTHALNKFMAWTVTEDWTVRELGESPND